MTSLTMLAEMMDADLTRAVEALTAVNIRLLDLKGQVFGRGIDDLDDERREQLAALVERHDARVYCFSSTLGYVNADQLGESAFRDSFDAGVENMIETARYVRPDKVRLLSCKFDACEQHDDATQYLDRHAPWIYTAYQDAIDRLDAAGLTVTIENELQTIMSNPAETLGFFERLQRPKVTFTWDIQNMWQSGTYPSLEAYRALRPLTDYVHLKGGRARPDQPRELAYRSSLAAATWPVREIVAEVLRDDASPVICLNPSHGAVDPGDEIAAETGRKDMIRMEALANVAFLREQFKEIA